MANLTQFQISKQYADYSGVSHAIEVDVAADTLYIEVNESRLLAKPADIEWLIFALSKARHLIDVEAA